MAVWKRSLLTFVCLLVGSLAAVEDLPFELAFDIEDHMHEPVAVVPIEPSTPAFLEDSAIERVGQPCKAGFQCPITNGVCCQGGGMCCAYRCTYSKKTHKWGCGMTDAMMAQRALLLLNKRKSKLDAEEQKQTDHQESIEKKQFQQWTHHQLKKKWKAELLLEKKKQDLALAKKQKKMMAKLKYIAAKAGVSLKNVDKKMKELQKKRDKKNPFLKGMNKAQQNYVKRSMIKLSGSYINYGRGYDVARWQMWRDICMLTGMIKGGGGKIAKLPSACRPMGGNLVFLQLKDNEPARIDVLRNGDVIDRTKSQGWVSLNGINFFTKNGTAVFLANGYDGYKNGFRSPFIKRYGDICMLSGVLTANPKWGQIGEVSRQCQPRWDIVLDAVDNHKPVRVSLGRNGSFYGTPPPNPKKTKWLGLDGMIWTSNKGNELPLLNGAKPHTATSSKDMHPTFWRVGNMVVLSGEVEPIKSTHVATLPPGYRPMKRLVFDTAHNKGVTRIDILNDGKVIFVDFPKRKFVSLAGIAFYVPRNDRKKAKQEEWLVSRDHAKAKGTAPKKDKGDGMKMDGDADSYNKQEFEKAKKSLMKVAKQYTKGFIKELP